MTKEWRGLYRISELLRMNPTGLTPDQMLVKLQTIRELAYTALRDAERERKDMPHDD